MNIYVLIVYDRDLRVLKVSDVAFTSERDAVEYLVFNGFKKRDVVYESLRQICKIQKVSVEMNEQTRM